MLISSKFKFCLFEAFSQLKNIFDLHLVESENLESVDPDGQLYVMDVSQDTWTKSCCTWGISTDGEKGHSNSAGR